MRKARGAPYLSMLVKLISHILSRLPAFDVLSLHFVDHLHGVLADTVERTAHTAIRNRPAFALANSCQMNLPKLTRWVP